VARLSVLRRLGVGAAALGLLGMTACSSYERIRLPGSAAGGGVSGGPSGAGGAVSDAALQGLTNAPASALGHGPSLAAAGTAVTGGTSAVAGGAATALAGGPGRKCTGTVKVGVTYSSDVNAALAGAGNPSAATQYGGYVKALQAEYQAGADHLNSIGGLGGCKVALAYYDFHTLSSDGFDAESQRECTSLAQDQHVALAFIFGLETKTLIDCMAKYKIPVSYHGGEYTVPNNRDYKDYHGYLYQETGISTDRWSPFMDDLAGAGYFDAGSKVGILLADDGNGNNQHLVNDIWKPRLAALGYPNPTVFTFTQLKSYAAIGDTQAQFSSAVLRFKALGIDHLIATPDSGNVTLFFPQQAESQNYHPRYAFTSVNYPELMKNVPADQAARSMSVSFLIADAENAGQMATNPPNPSRTQCDRMFAGKTNGGPAPYLYCDFLNVMSTALRDARQIDAPTLLAGVESLGTSIAGAGNYGGTRLSPGRYDGGAVVRVMEWDPAIKDYRYITGVLNVP
jgi:hypothetical protein